MKKQKGKNILHDYGQKMLLQCFIYIRIRSREWLIHQTILWCYYFNPYQDKLAGFMKRCSYGDLKGTFSRVLIKDCHNVTKWFDTTIQLLIYIDLSFCSYYLLKFNFTFSSNTREEVSSHHIFLQTLLYMLLRFHMQCLHNIHQKCVG